MQPLKTLPEEEPASIKQREEQQKTLLKARKQLRYVIEDFPQLQPRTQQYWLKYALERPEIPESTELLRKYGEKEVTLPE